MDPEANSFNCILDRHFIMNKDSTADVFRFLLEEEKKLDCVTNYIEQIQENQITAKMRMKLIEWMIQLSDEMTLGYNTKYSAIMLVDLVLSKLKIHKKYLQLLGITAILIFVKYEESFQYTLEHCCEFCANAFTREEISTMEMLILNTLKWKIHFSTPGEIARRAIYSFNKTLCFDLGQFFRRVDEFIDRMFLNIESALFQPSVIAIAAALCSFEEEEHLEAWKHFMQTNYSELDYVDLFTYLYDQNAIDYLYNMNKVYHFQKSFITPESKNRKKCTPEKEKLLNSQSTTASSNCEMSTELTTSRYSQETQFENSLDQDSLLECSSNLATPVPNRKSIVFHPMKTEPRLLEHQEISEELATGISI